MVLSGKIIVVDDLSLQAIKTKDICAFLKAVGAEGKTMMVMPEVREAVIKSARNIPGVMTTTATIISVYDILNAEHFIIDRAAVPIIEEVFA